MRLSARFDRRPTLRFDGIEPAARPRAAKTRMNTQVSPRLRPVETHRHFPVDKASVPMRCGDISLVGDVTGDGRMTERVRCLRAGLVTPLPGGSGNRPAGTMTGLRAARWTGTGGGG
jgi:hypothetical protein